MQTEETEFWLYLSEASEQALTRFIRTFQQKYDNSKIVVNRVDFKDEFFQQKGNVIVSDLCEPPYWQLTFLNPLESVVFTAYRLCLIQGFSACLFDPKTETVFASFQEGLFARKVAHLWYKKGRSDKVYHIYLNYEPNTKFYTVIRRYGKRDGVLKQLGKSYDSLREAEEKWERIFERKIRKGYKLHRTFQAVQLELEFPNFSLCRGRKRIGF